MKRVFAVVVSAPILALFVGVGTLAFSIAGTWDERNTDVLISNITMVCGMSGLVLALLFAPFVGLVFYSRWQRDHGWNDPSSWGGTHVRRLPQSTQQIPAWMEQPPLLTAEQDPKGRLYSSGPNSYEDLDTTLFDDGQPIHTEWSELP